MALQESSMRLLAISLLCFSFAGCNALYRAPEAVAKPVDVSSPLAKTELYQKAVKALMAEGFAVAMADKDLGIITSQRREMALTSADADMGTTMGLDYVNDNRTTEYVTVTIEVQDKKAIIRTELDGEYLPNDPVHGKRLKGVSRGTIEAKIAKRISE